MATHKGSEGLIKVGSNAVAEIFSDSLTENVDLIETTNIADAARAYTTGKTSWGGEIACNRDETNTNGQGALTIGASVTLNVYPEGAASSDTYYSGSAIVTSLDKSAEAVAHAKNMFDRYMGDKPLMVESSWTIDDALKTTLRPRFKTLTSSMVRAAWAIRKPI